MLNAYQKICAKTYAAGEYDGLEKTDGDSLFNFLMRELSTEEDCQSIDDARFRIRTVVKDVKCVLDVLMDPRID
ncbi:hypothetical protein BMS3Bbin13_00081 [bacterium BMS3Bbin13]|nr:hypothetical protein BMS3Bbin13_00081 [bacterium BMS3Bbin13]